MHHALEEIFSASVELAHLGTAEEYDRLIGSSRKPLVLMGAGEVGRNLLAVLRQNNIEVICFADNNPLRWGWEFEGLPVHSPLQAAQRFGNEAVIVVAFKCSEPVFEKEATRLRRFGAHVVCDISVLLRKWPEACGWPYESATFYLDRTQIIQAAFDLLSDEESRRQFIGHLRWRLLRDYPALPSGDPRDQYFCEDIIRLSENECFIDGGAFDGDTISSFLYSRCELFAKVHAFEPDPKSFAALEAFVSRLAPSLAQRISIYPYALGEREGNAFFTALGTHSSYVGGNAGGIPVRTVALDAFLRDEKPTFIKLDLEGAEMRALAGAARSIREQGPILAVAVYHQPSDLFQIPLRIRDLHGGYRFYLRTHNHFGLDIVLYAIPAGRTHEL